MTPAKTYSLFAALCMNSHNFIAYGLVAALTFDLASCFSEEERKQKLHDELITVGSSPINCKVHVYNEAMKSSLACTFPLDIATFHLGFNVYVKSNKGTHDMPEVVSSCYWDSEAVKLRCLGKETGAAAAIYDKTTRTATVPIPLAAAKTYFLFCELLEIASVQTHPCQHLMSDHTHPVDCSWYQMVNFLLAGLLLIAFIALVILIRSRLSNQRLRTSDTNLSQSQSIRMRLRMSDTNLSQSQTIRSNNSDSHREHRATLRTTTLPFATSDPRSRSKSAKRRRSKDNDSPTGPSGKQQKQKEHDFWLQSEEEGARQNVFGCG